MSSAPLRVGVAGLGLAARLVVESLLEDPRVELVAGADPDPASREWFVEATGGLVHESVEALCAAGADVVWVATPTRLHRQHVLLAVAAGADVVVEKPMAVSVADCDAMVAAAAAAGVLLLAGGVRSLDPAFRAMRAVVNSGRIGELRTVQSASFTAWLARPRSAADLDEALGGGLLFNQAPHQLDVVRTLAGGARVTSVRARAGAWSRTRPGIGYYTADVELEGGVFASLTYDGYGRIDPSVDRVHEPCERCATQRPWVPTDAGVVVAVCGEGEVRQVAHGLEVSTAEGRTLVDVPDGDANTVAVDQLLAARAGVPLEQSGRWGRETQAAVVALVESTRRGRRVQLNHM
ncbi:Gfo/Idh/MocA family oxidoreductase [Nocardioides sp. 31GB23]|uniref:Gfo/Idh/MocA family protein n=1 Tax=Nocardioides sp. 31GB23 TaxID=3156065 RepID=UPI0032AFE088